MTSNMNKKLLGAKSKHRQVVLSAGATEFSVPVSGSGPGESNLEKEHTAS